MKARICLPVALALTMLVIAGCGGGDDSTASAPVATTATTTALSKEDLIAQGDAICAEVNAAVGTVSSTGADSAGQVAQEAALYTGMVGRLKGLGTPDDSAGYSEVISTADELAQAEGDARLAAERGDSSGLAAAESSASTALVSFQSAAQAYGFEDCGERPSAPVSSTATTPSSTTPAEVAPEEPTAAPAPETSPNTGGAGSAEGGGGSTGGGTSGGGTESGGGSGSGGIGPG
ncbi:MAG: hypothetical protein FVQ78_08300 [Solirubrobacterales bacterium]|nr:hypothetical protein [Solirubrobacterales bacterium]